MTEFTYFVEYWKDGAEYPEKPVGTMYLGCGDYTMQTIYEERVDRMFRGTATWRVFALEPATKDAFEAAK